MCCIITFFGLNFNRNQNIFFNKLQLLSQQKFHQLVTIGVKVLDSYLPDGAIVIGGVVINPFCQVAAAGVICNLKSVPGADTAPLLKNAVEGVKKVVYNGAFIVPVHRIFPYKRGFYES